MVIRLIVSFSLLYNLNVFGCELKKNSVVLSAPIVYLLEELDLLKDPKLKAITSFSKVGAHKAEVLGGGIFLSKQTLKKYKKNTFVLDKSFELEKTLSRAKISNFIIYETLNETPFQAVEKGLSIVRQLSERCDQKINQLKTKISKIQNKLKNLPKRKAIFFLGAIEKDGTLPPQIIGRDGFVLYLIENDLIDTYKSDLAYISWSQKELNKYRDDFLFIGLLDRENIQLDQYKISNKRYNLYFDGVFSPGIKQVYFLNFLSKISF